MFTLFGKNDNKDQFDSLLSVYRVADSAVDAGMQVPRYIITIHQLLAHTPHDHVERRSLDFALGKLEEISQVSTAALLLPIPLNK